MKKILAFCAVGAAVSALAVSCCCGGKQKVTAVVAGPDKVAAVVVEYPEAIDAESVCPEAYEVEGREVVCAKVCKGGKVVVALKPECCKKACCEEKAECDKPCCEEQKPECCKEKAECAEKAECCKEKAECNKPCCEEQKPECCKEKAECAEKAECCKEKAECDKPCCEEQKPECCKEECEIPVPDIAVKQVVAIKTAEGKVVKAWKKAVKATEAVPACHKPFPPKPECCGEKPECGAQPCNKPADQQCDKCKAAAAAE